MFQKLFVLSVLFTMSIDCAMATDPFDAWAPNFLNSDIKELHAKSFKGTGARILVSENMGVPNYPGFRLGCIEDIKKTALEKKKIQLSMAEKLQVLCVKSRQMHT